MASGIWWCPVGLEDGVLDMLAMASMILLKTEPPTLGMWRYFPQDEGNQLLMVG